jgi:hypothetical protein
MSGLQVEIGQWCSGQMLVSFTSSSGNARRLAAAKLSKFKTTFTLSTAAYCAVHWLLTHSFSIYMASGALWCRSGNVYRMVFRLVLFDEGVKVAQ